MSEAGFESANHAVQVLGGHGFISEWQLEQQVRDARITMIYEGTNGIQALDLLGRKVLRDQGKTLKAWVSEIKDFADSQLDSKALRDAARSIAELCDQWLELTQQIATKAQSNMEEVGAAAFDFLMYSGYISVAHILLQLAAAAQTSDRSNDFKMAKRQTLNFYVARILPRTKMHQAAILSGCDNLECVEFALD